MGGDSSKPNNEFDQDLDDILVNYSVSKKL